MNRVLRTSVIATTVLAGALGVAGPASAGTAAKPLDTVKKAVTSRIDLRLTALQRFSTTLSGAKQVQAGHRATLTKLIGDQTAGLTALRGKVAGETTGAAVKADAKAMVDDYRVFLLTGPKVRLTAAIDTELVADGRLKTRKNADVAKLNAVQAGLAGKVDTLLAIQPAPDGAGIRAKVKVVKDAARSARTELKSLRKK